MRGRHLDDDAEQPAGEATRRRGRGDGTRPGRTIDGHRLRARRPGLARALVPPLRTVRWGAGAGNAARGGPRAPGLRGLRAHRLLQPAAGGHHAPRDGRGRGGAPAAGDRARVRSVGAAGRLPRGGRDRGRGGGPRDPGGDGPPRPARASWSGSTRGWRRRSSCWSSRRGSSAARRTRRPRPWRSRRSGPDGIPWDGIAFKTSWWAIHDWVRLRHPGVAIPEGFRGDETF